MGEETVVANVLEQTMDQAATMVSESSKVKGPVYVYNRTRETFVATEARVANGYFTRLVGLLGKTRRWAKPGRGLWIIPSHGVHTIGMLFALDLVFLDRNMVVVHVEEHVRPFRISKVSLKTMSILELPPHTVFRSGTRVGDRLEISSAEPDSAR
jgi:uncharacterized membrane protein (UPF0127 family)